MVNEIKYTSINRVLDNIMDHPLLSDVTLDQAIRHTVRFISLHGYNQFYYDRIVKLDIHDYRALLPCDLIRILQVKDGATGLCLRATTDTFTKGLEPDMPPMNPKAQDPYLLQNNYIPPVRDRLEERTFKTQGRVIYTSFPEGEIEVSYKAIPVDENEFPLLIDDETYLAALEAYIKMRVFTVKFDTGKIGLNVLQNAQKDYGIYSKELQMNMTLPNISEMQAITNAWNSLIAKPSEFYRGFRHNGDREFLWKH